MAVRKIDCTVSDSRKNITMRNDPTRIDPMKLKLGKLRIRSLERLREVLETLHFSENRRAVGHPIFVGSSGGSSE